MWKDRSSIENIFLSKMVLIVMVSLVAWSLIWIYGEYKEFQSRSQILRREHLQSRKKLLQKEVSDVIHYIKREKNRSEKALEATLQQRVENAHRIAAHIYQRNKESLSNAQIGRRISEALRMIRFDGGRGSYFIVSMDGVVQLAPGSPAMEGVSVLQDQDSRRSLAVGEEIDLIRTQKEGFVQHLWRKPDGNPYRMYRKKSYIKAFPPLGWYLGAGEYVTEAREHIKRKILRHVAELRFGEEGYFFGSTFDGHSLFSNGKVTVGEGNIWDLTDPNGVKVIQEQQRVAKDQGGGFVRYAWRKLGEEAPSPKLSYVEGIQEWQWTIGAGVYLDTVEKTIAANRDALQKRLSRKIAFSLGVLVVLFSLVYFWAARVSRQLKGTIDFFVGSLQKASTDSSAIATQHIDLREFKKIAEATNSMLAQRRKIEDELRHSREQFEKMIKKSPLAMAVVDENGDISFFNEKFTESFGYTLEDVSTAEQWWQSAYPDVQYRQRVKTAWNEAYENARRRQTEIEPQHWRLTTKDGRERFCEFYTMPMDEFSLIIVKDITERRVAEADRERLLTAIEQTAETIMITDAEGRIQYVNPAFEYLSGYSREEVIGENPRFLKSDRHDRDFYADIWKTITAGRTWQGRLVNRRKDGQLLTEETTVSPVFDDDNKIVNYVAVKRDITKELEMEQKLLQSQKMESIGTLAGGIAHDFNNILAPILGHSEMLLGDMTEDTPMKKSLEDIFASARRARELVQQILTFSRQEKSDYDLIDLPPVVEDALKMIRATIPSFIIIKHEIDPQCGAVRGSATHVHQVVMNLATNAYHAMADSGGEITISLKEIEFGSFDLISPEMEPGRYACLSISDTGVGMAEELARKIFDPFFTTKESGKGTGMGLSVVHGIVNRLGGTIQVHSKPGEGSAFHVYLPTEEIVREEKKAAADSIPHSGSERILVVDDEKAIATMMTRMLERMGYRVTAKTNSIEALEIFRADPEGFDLVITDMTMPHMSGDQLSRRLLDERPSIPVLICTGYSEIMNEQKAAEFGIRGFIMKPLVSSELSAKIREVLSGGGNFEETKKVAGGP